MNAPFINKELKNNNNKKSREDSAAAALAIMQLWLHSMSKKVVKTPPEESRWVRFIRLLMLPYAEKGTIARNNKTT